MGKNNKHYLIIFVLFLLILFSFPKSFANESINFLSLKNNEVNLRQGPSFEYPIKFIYKKKYLPVEILDESETWRKIRDFEHNSGWIHISQLSKKKSAINIKNISKEFLDNLNQDTLKKLENHDISDQDRYILNQKLDILKEIRI